MARHLLLLAIGASLAVTGCATPEARVRSGLMDAGLNRAISACMADRMVDRLSLLQLRRLGRLGRFKDADDRRAMTTQRFLHNARSLGDGEILGVMASSAAICTVRPD